MFATNAGSTQSTRSPCTFVRGAVCLHSLDMTVTDSSPDKGHAATFIAAVLRTPVEGSQDTNFEPIEIFRDPTPQVQRNQMVKFGG